MSDGDDVATDASPESAVLDILRRVTGDHDYGMVTAWVVSAMGIDSDGDPWTATATDDDSLAILTEALLRNALRKVVDAQRCCCDDD